MCVCTCVCVFVCITGFLVLLSAPLPCFAAESYTSVLSEAVLDWGSVGPDEEWVNSATHKGEQGKAQLSLSPK